MHILTIIAATEAPDSGAGTLGINLYAFVVQLVTFVLFFFVLKKFAFKPIILKLERRRKLIEDGVKLGSEMQKERAHLADEVALAMNEAREEADRLIAEGKKEAQELVKQADVMTRYKSELILNDAKVRIRENTQRARRELEKDIALLIGEATEVILGEKLDPKKDAELIKKAMKQQASV